MNIFRLRSFWVASRFQLRWKSPKNSSPLMILRYVVPASLLMSDHIDILGTIIALHAKVCSKHHTINLNIAVQLTWEQCTHEKKKFRLISFLHPPTIFFSSSFVYCFVSTLPKMYWKCRVWSIPNHPSSGNLFIDLALKVHPSLSLSPLPLPRDASIMKIVKSFVLISFAVCLCHFHFQVDQNRSPEILQY